MRLIDADELKEYVRKIGFYCDTEADKEYTIKQMDSLFSTVEAIPIEWIKKWMNERNDWSTIPYNQHIWNMLDDWEKENE